jgi:hypothetical protein
MNELNRPHAERIGRPPGAAGLFDRNDTFGQIVTVSSGPYLEQLPVGNSTVGEIRRRFADRFDIDPQAQAVLDGNVAGDDTVVRAGQALMFTRRAGEKGSGLNIPKRVIPQANTSQANTRIEDGE